VTAADRALALDPECGWALRLRAIALLRQDKSRLALEAAQRGAALDPTLDSALYVLAIAQLNTGAAAQARITAELNVSHNPHSPLAFSTAATIALAQRRWADAEALSRQGLELDPQDSDLMLHLGVALDRQGRSGQAGEAFAAATRADPTDHRARRALARIGLPAVGGGLIVASKVGFAFKGVWIALIGTRAVGALGGDGAPPARAGAEPVTDSTRLQISLTVVAVLGLVFLAAFARREIPHRRARAKLSPSLQAIVRRERRPAYVPWLRGAAAFGVGAALLTWPEGAWPVSLVALAVALVAAVQSWRWSGPHRGPQWLGRLAQRFR
jgi:tetratricopeptide (TPR) repeat protein